MNIDLKESNTQELNCYKIALYQVIINCNNQIARIKIKLDKIKKEKEESEK